MPRKDLENEYWHVRLSAMASTILMEGASDADIHANGGSLSRAPWNKIKLSQIIRNGGSF